MSRPCLLSGVVGAGLAIFSRFPIISASIHPYSLSGIPMDSVGDWFAAKSAASVVISHPILGPIQVFNTHVCVGFCRCNSL